MQRWFGPAAVLLLAGCTAAPGPATQDIPVGVCGRTDHPVAVVSRTYLVFFEPGSPALTPRARQVIEELASARERLGGDGLIVIQAHVDGAEAKAAHGLDLRRALTVRGELVADGVPVLALPMVSDGFDTPLVPTGGAEPQNRYVSFVLAGVGEERIRVQIRSCAEWVKGACLPSKPTASREACEAALRSMAL